MSSLDNMEIKEHARRVAIMERNINTLRAALIHAKDRHRDVCMNGTIAQQVGAQSTVSDLSIAFALATGTAVGGAQFAKYLREGYSVATD